MAERCFLLDEGTCGDDDLPRPNLLSTVTALEHSDSSASMERVVGALIGGETAERLSRLLDGLTAPGQLAEVGDWIIDCDTGEDLIERAGRVKGRGIHL